MIYCDFQGKKLSQLGFGAMRLPVSGGAIDEAQVEAMVAAAMEANGFVISRRLERAGWCAFWAEQK